MFGYDVFGAPQKSFAASISGFVDTNPNMDLYDILRQKLPEAGSGPSQLYPRQWAYDNVYLVSDDDYLGNNSNPYNYNDIAKLFHNYGQTTISNPDQVKLYSGDAFEFEARAGTVAKFRVEFINNKGGNAKTTYNYVVNIKKNSVSVPTACNSSSSSYSAWSNYSNTDTTSGASGVTSFEVELDGDSGSYLGIDMNQDSSNVHASRFKTANGTWQTNKSSPYGQGIDRVQITLLSITKKPISGCTDTQANNYDSKATANAGCRYTTTAINSFTTTPSVVKVGEPITIAWSLASEKFSNVSIMHDGTDLLAGTGKTQDQSSSITFTPTTVGGNKFELKVTWNKSNSGTPKSNTSVNVQSATSYIQCTDSNRATDVNGECADCKTGYFLDTTTGLCSQCSDPNRSKNTDGTCGDCIDRYELTAAGICEPVIAGGNDCTDSNRETNADGSCASSCKSGYSFDSSNYCQSDSDSTTASPMGITGILVGVGLLTAVALIA